jgi:hypothetical protein
MPSFFRATTALRRGDPRRVIDWQVLAPSQQQGWKIDSDHKERLVGVNLKCPARKRRSGRISKDSGPHWHRSYVSKACSGSSGSRQRVCPNWRKGAEPRRFQRNSLHFGRPSIQIFPSFSRLSSNTRGSSSPNCGPTATPGRQSHHYRRIPIHYRDKGRA